jgi:predicted transposase YdaD
MPNESHHDHSYKDLFSHREMVRDLLVGFVRQDWLALADLDSLETVKGSFITDDLREREDDIIWRLRWGDGWLYVYLLIEFQSSIDRYMAVRIANYVTLLYQDLIAQGHLAADGRLPPVLPIVLYNGEPRWNAAVELAELIAPVPGGLDAYRPSSRYLLLDEGAIINDPTFPAEVRNLAAALFQLEHARDEATWLKVYERLVGLLDSQALGSLKRAFGRWIYKSFVRKKRPGIRLPDIDDYQEVHAVLEQRVEQWNRELIEKGRLEGLKEGRREGWRAARSQGEARLLRQMTHRFGPLPSWVESRLTEATDAELDALAEALLDADTLDAVFADGGNGH